jgi:hypothetical protein
MTSTTALGIASTLAGTARAGGNVVSKVASDGHYAWFPLDSDSWGRSQNPVDKKQDVEGQQQDARWLAKPAKGGGIRCQVENLPTPFRNAGFDIHLGALGSVEKLTVASKTRQTNSGNAGTVVAALYFDVNDNGEFFAWKDAKGNTEAWAGFCGDTERGLARPATGSFTIDDETKLPVFADPDDPPTLGEIKAGSAIDGVNGTTNAAVYLGVASLGGGTEEIVVESVDITRS